MLRIILGRIAAVRLWLTPALCLAAAVVAVLPLFKPSLGVMPWPAVWPCVLLAAATCWLTTDVLRWLARLMLGGTAVGLAFHLLRTVITPIHASRNMGHHGA